MSLLAIFDLTKLEWLLAIVYLIGGLNDLFLDLIFYIRPWRRKVAQGRANPTCEEAELYATPEQRIAILIPAWDESKVIAAMLEATADRLRYDLFDLFVGTYPNDEATQLEVARVAMTRPRIHRVVCPHPGPTSKADCLNWIVEAINLHETETGKRYEIFVLQDAEDVVHPLSLKVFNRFIPRYDLIQLPVIPYERGLHRITGNTYLDEFAEVHLKGLTSRLAVGGMVPSAGVGTGFSRSACDQLAEQTNHVLFPPTSLTEDYDFSFRLFRNRRSSALAEVWVDRIDARGRVVKELVAIREFFPNTFADAIRQKQRWLLGITFQGAQRLGWGHGWRERYMLLRDRIGLATSFFNVIALMIFMRLAELMVEAHLQHLPWTAGLPPYDRGSALSLVIDVNLILLCNRVAQRAVFVRRVARRRQMLLTPLRMLWGNVIDLCCALQATRRFLSAQITGRPLKWLKTPHEFPSIDVLMRRHRPLGDILLERRLITPAQLTEALNRQRQTGLRHQFLGEILQQIAALSTEALLGALSLQEQARELSSTIAARRPSIDADPTPTPITLVVRARTQAAGKLSHFAGQSLPPTVDLQPRSIDPVARAPRGVPRNRVATKIVSLRLPDTNGSRPSFTETAPAVTGLVADIGLLPPRPSIPDTGTVAGLTAGSMSRRFTMLHTLPQTWSTTLPPAPIPIAEQKRFLVVIGTRPEAIKLAPLIFELRARAIAEGRPDDVFVCLSGQHRDMVREPLTLFGITPDLDLGLMHEDQTLATLSARVLDGFGRVLAQLRPDWVVVQGDTATTTMAALAAFYAGVKVAHIEAGLRTNDLQNPFPEEANRRMVTLVASMHFAATESARKNLLREGIKDHTIHVTGNTGIDALRLHCGRIGISLNALPILSGPVRVLVTAHRRENLASGIDNICKAIRAVVLADPGRFQFVWPLHPNPQVADRVRSLLARLPGITLSQAVPYDRLLALLAQCDLVLTDSGGLQEEAPSFGKQVLILRDATERPEGVYAGLARLVGTRPRELQLAIEESALQIEALRASHANRGHRTLSPDIPVRAPFNPYGDGRASTRIADFFDQQTVEPFIPAKQALKRPPQPAALPHNLLQSAGSHVPRRLHSSP